MLVVRSQLLVQPCLPAGVPGRQLEATATAPHCSLHGDRYCWLGVQSAECSTRAAVAPPPPAPWCVYGDRDCFLLTAACRSAACPSNRTRVCTHHRPATTPATPSRTRPSTRRPRSRATGAGSGSTRVSRKALSFCCASTVFLSKTVPFHVVPLSQASRSGSGTSASTALATRCVRQELDR
eukprot:SAG22_NODE_2019_length_3129_cov_1.934653_3_plen_181_part_00